MKFGDAWIDLVASLGVIACKDDARIEACIGAIFARCTRRLKLRLCQSGRLVDFIGGGKTFFLVILAQLLITGFVEFQFATQNLAIVTASNVRRFVVRIDLEAIFSIAILLAYKYRSLEEAVALVTQVRFITREYIVKPVCITLLRRTIGLFDIGERRIITDSCRRDDGRLRKCATRRLRQCADDGDAKRVLVEGIVETEAIVLFD